jgi:3-hydroxyisobutyrate dehydrogenase-like beta-hydroxyacid dehydrogenase
MAKDLGLMSDVAAARKIAAPVTDAARQAYDEATADGWGDREGIMLAAWRASRTGAA